MDLNEIFDIAHKNSKAAGWWVDPITGLGLIPGEDGGTMFEKFVEAWFPYVIATKIALIHSEVSEALEGYRRDAPDDKLPHRAMIEVELADVIIRVGDLARALELDVVAAIQEKFPVNVSRPDHAMENRRKLGGKKF